ncbi:LysR family transcriptional regulator, partial [Bacillus sp. JJ664]
MELKQLEYFMALCEEMHFTRTAEKLGIGQPNLSYQIKALEDELGVPLFDRIGKKNALTQAGKILFEHSTIVFETIKSANNQIQDLQKMHRGKLVIGALSGDLSHIASTVLLEFHTMYPHIKLQFYSLDEVLEKVKQNELDLALTIMPTPDERFNQISLYEEEFFLVVRSDHPFSKLNEIDLNDIQSTPLILNPKGHSIRQLFDEICSFHGIELYSTIETTDTKAIIRYVIEGKGATILSGTLFNLENNGILKAIRIKNPSIFKEVIIVHHKQKHIGTVAKGFIDLLIENVKMNRYNMDVR